MVVWHGLNRWLDKRLQWMEATGRHYPNPAPSTSGKNAMPSCI
ncbi:hypothetical protein GFS31_00460 [Leptolyngbya sp. BL0902]|nr:hypothetical protein GFS31_00460 [Leptolyngbya sp. BL0902]